jgi:2-oxoglutarate/2-oxoacid ferredoxin oxidoreductase subunit beta
MTKLQELSQKSAQFQAFETPQKHTWCSGCGNFGILNAVTRSLVLEGYEPHQVMLCYDVGCSGNESDKVIANTIHGLHGRVLPLAAGIKLANTKMPVIATAGDGATFSEGINHLIHAIKSNYNLTFILHNNQNYGLTTGQASSTTPKGIPMNGSSQGKVEDVIHTMQTVMSLQPAFVARSFSGNVTHLTELLRQAINFPGFAYIEVLQACPTYNKTMPIEWYLKRVKPIEEFEGYDKHDIEQAKEIVKLDNQEIYPIGVLYENPDSTSFYQRLIPRQNLETEPLEEVDHFDVSELLTEFV